MNDLQIQIAGIIGVFLIAFTSVWLFVVILNGWMKMQLKYLSYIIRHKWFVFLECSKRGYMWRGITHDMSKLLTREWGPYSFYFYGGSLPSITDKHGEERQALLNSKLYKEHVQHEFDFAWLQHIHRNDHHWQWWVLREDDGATKMIPMSHAARIEMLCDWIGAGWAQFGKQANTAKWYMKNRENIKLHPITRSWIEVNLFGREL